MVSRLVSISVIASFAAGLAVATFAPFREFLPGLLGGALVTLQITIAGSVVAVVSAFIAAMTKMYAIAPLRWLAVTYIEIFRGTSLLVQLFWAFFVLPHFGLTLEPMAVAILTIGLSYGAYGAELIRGAVLSVPRGQWEATVALNMSRATALRRIVLPQALLAMIPPWGNLFIELLKGTALVSLITITDLAFRAQQMNQTTFRTVEIFTLVLVFYFGIAQAISAGMRMLEQKAAGAIARGRAE